MSEGYIYCLSNKLFNGIYKIGITDKTPEIFIKEINSNGITLLPMPYKIEFAKKISKIKDKENALNNLLYDYLIPNNPEGKFYKISIEVIKNLFEFMDGEIWVPLPPK
jgi:hypothetical protein